MSLDSVELLFVARSVVNECFMEPSASLDSGVSSNHVVSLILEQLLNVFGNQGVQSESPSNVKGPRSVFD